jgi:hypothetical protein
MRVNRFFSSVIRIQTDRGQYVVTTGPYAFVEAPRSSRTCGPQEESPGLTEAVEKVPKYGAANFALKDKTSGDRHSIGPQLDYGSRR